MSPLGAQRNNLDAVPSSVKDRKSRVHNPRREVGTEEKEPNQDQKGSVTS